MPDGTPGVAPASVVFLNGEDTNADTVHPRLEALGADTDRVFVWDDDEPLCSSAVERDRTRRRGFIVSFLPIARQ